VRDLKDRFERWGELSTKQVALAIKIASEPPRPAEANVPAPVSDKRLTIEGDVVSTKIYESDFGEQLRMVVKVTTPQGVWLCFGSVPSVPSGCVERGDRVRFDAKLQAGRDAHFAFFKRPTKATLLAKGSSCLNDRGSPTSNSA